MTLTAFSTPSGKVVMLLKYTMQCFSVSVVVAFGRLLRTPHIGNSPETYFYWVERDNFREIKYIFKTTRKLVTTLKNDNDNHSQLNCTETEKN